MREKSAALGNQRERILQNTEYKDDQGHEKELQSMVDRIARAHLPVRGAQGHGDLMGEALSSAHRACWGWTKATEPHIKSWDSIEMSTGNLPDMCCGTHTQWQCLAHREERQNIYTDSKVRWAVYKQKQTTESIFTAQAEDNTQPRTPSSVKPPLRVKIK